MIGHISGKIVYIEDNHVVVSVGGVGYEVVVPADLSDRLISSTEIELFIHTNLRENALELFGFRSLWEKKVFHLLTSVSGVGPRTALSILSGIDASTLLEAILHEDKARLSTAPGVGKKTAERLIVELQSKAQKLLLEAPSGLHTQASNVKNNSGKKLSRPPMSIMNEALAALLGLGYAEADALQALQSALEGSEPETSLNALIKKALQLLSRREPRQMGRLS